MVQLQIQLSDEVARRIKSEAEQKGVAPEQLAGDYLSERFAAVSEEFKQLAEEELEENAELYKRLS